MVTRIQPAVGDPDAARTLAGLLARLPGTETAPAAADSARLLDALAAYARESVSRLPEVVLVHEGIGPAPALELIREVALRFPAVAVVLVTADTSPPLYSAAMDAGARGVLGLPLDQEELAARVGAAATWAAGVRRHLGAGGGHGGVPADADGGTGPDPGGGFGSASGGRPPGTLVAVVGAKGGVGTTLTAVQLALAAQEYGRETALVDMDLQSGDVASYLDVRFRRSVADLAGIDDLSPRVLQDAVYPHESGLGLLLAPGEGERGEEVDDRAARQIVGALRARYDAVIVDCGGQLTAGSAAAVELADQTVLLTTPDVVSVRAAKRMVRLWSRLRIRAADEAVALVNRASRLSDIQPPLIARIVGTPVARSTVPANFKELQTAVDAGRVQDLDDKATVKQALRAFAAELGLVPGGSGRGTGVRLGGRATRRTGGGSSGPAASGYGPGSGISGAGASGLGASVAVGPGPAASGYGPGAGGGDGVGGDGALPGGGRGLDPGAGAGRQALPPPGPVPPGPPLSPASGAPTGGPGAGVGPVPGQSGGGTVPTSAGPWFEPSARTQPGRTQPDRRDPDPYPYGDPEGLSAWAGEENQETRQDQPDEEPADRQAESGERGSVTLEFAGMAPIVLVVLALLWQCVLVGYTFSLAGDAADEAARAATAAASGGGTSGGGDAQGACRRAAVQHLPRSWKSRSAVDCRRSGRLWKADVNLRTPILFPGAASLPVDVSGSAGAAEEG